MYLIVVERTSEIGLRMALGARTWQIMLQFIAESAVLVIIAAFIGLALSGLAVGALHYVPLPEWIGKPTLSFFVLFTTLAILALIALVAAYFPARQAAKMKPIEALVF